MTIGAAQGFEDHVTLTEGRLPAVTAPVGQPFEVLVSAEQAAKLGYQVDETYLLVGETGGGERLRCSSQSGLQASGRRVTRPGTTGFTSRGL